MPNNTSPFIPSKLPRVKMSKACANFHPSSEVHCPQIKSNIIYPFSQDIYIGLSFTHVFLSDPHPIQQRLLPTCFKRTLDPTTSHILLHWHLSLCCAHTSQTGNTLLTGVPAAPLLSSPTMEARATLWKHQPSTSLLALNPPKASLDPTAFRVLTMAPQAYRVSALATCLLSLLTIPAHGMWPHWPPCLSLKISRPQPLLLPFLACYVPKYWYL